MSTGPDLMGLGMPGALAERLGNTAISITAAGTSAGTATLLSGGHVYNVTSASSQTGAILNANVSIGEIIFISCAHSSGASAVIYPPTGATITNASSVTLAADKNMIVWRFSTTLFFHVILA